MITLFFYAVFPACVVPIVFGSRGAYSLGMVLTMGFLFLFTIIKPKSIYKSIIQLLKFSAVKILALYIVVLAFSLVVHAFIGTFHFGSILSFLYRTSIIILPLFFGFYATKFFKFNAILKFYYFIIYLALIIGVVEFIIFYFDIGFLTDLYNTVNNSRQILNNHITRAYVNDFPRIQSGFDEPAYFAYWLDSHIPLIYNLSFSKANIFKNKSLDTFIKKTFPILLWIVILGIQSPIHIIFALIITVFYIMIEKLKISLKKILLAASYVLPAVWGCLYYLMSADLYGTFLFRIQMFLKTITNFNLFVFAEPSLATRIISYANMIYVFLKHPFAGCGLGNFAEAITLQSQKSPLPYTEEYLARQMSTKYVPTNGSILYIMLAEQGIFLTLIFFTFIFSTIKILHNSEKLSSGVQKELFQGLKYMVVIYFCLCFYESFFQYYWMEFGLMFGFIYKLKKQTGGICN